MILRRLFLIRQTKQISSFVESDDLTPEKKTAQRHYNIREIQKNLKVLEDIPYQSFLKIVGLYESFYIDVNEEVNKLLAEKFKILRDFIDAQLVADGQGFAKNEMIDYVHNLHLLLIGIAPVEYLEASIHLIREEYLNHSGEKVYNLYLTSPFKLALNQCLEKPLDNESGVRYIKLLRTDYKNLLCEIRRFKVYEGHIETTREYLIKAIAKTLFNVIILPITIILFYLIYSSIRLGVNTSLPKDLNNLPNWFALFTAVAMIASNAVAGGLGSFVSVLLRIQGVKENNQLAQDILAFKHSEKAVKLAPLSGVLFSSILCLLFGSGLIGGTIFPIPAKPWMFTFFDASQFSKWLIWSFIAGFTERLVPDMIDRLSDKAKKAEDQ